MSIIAVLLPVCLVAFFVWVILKIEVPAPFQQIIIGVAVVLIVIYLLQVFGADTGPLPRIRLW